MARTACSHATQYHVGTIGITKVALAVQPLPWHTAHQLICLHCLYTPSTSQSPPACLSTCQPPRWPKVEGAAQQSCCPQCCTTGITIVFLQVVLLHSTPCMCTTHVPKTHILVAYPSNSAACFSPTMVCLQDGRPKLSKPHSSL